MLYQLSYAPRLEETIVAARISRSTRGRPDRFPEPTGCGKGPLRDNDVTPPGRWLPPAVSVVVEPRTGQWPGTRNIRDRSVTRARRWLPPSLSRLAAYPFRVPLGILFLFLCVCLLGVAYAAARAGGSAWIIAAAAVAIALWLGNAGVAMLRRWHR